MNLVDTGKYSAILSFTFSLEKKLDNPINYSKIKENTRQTMLKQNVLDVLIYLFETYSDDDSIQPPDREELESELIRAGFEEESIERALKWIDDLTVQIGFTKEADEHIETLNLGLDNKAALPSIRVYTLTEKTRISQSCRGYLHHLEQIGILDHEQLERVIDRVMALDKDNIDIEELQWVVLMVLFSQPEQELAFQQMEDLIYMENGGIVH